MQRADLPSLPSPWEASCDYLGNATSAENLLRSQRQVENIFEESSLVRRIVDRPRVERGTLAYELVSSLAAFANSFA